MTRKSYLVVTRSISLSGVHNKHSYLTLSKVKGQTLFSKIKYFFFCFFVLNNFYISIIPNWDLQLCFVMTAHNEMMWARTHRNTDGRKGVSGLGALKWKKRSREARALRRKWATKYEIAKGGATSETTFLSGSEEADITASAYKHLGNEAPAVPGSGHADLSISSMHYSPRTAILPPAAPGKDWFRFLFICFSFPPSPSTAQSPAFLSAAFQLN